MLGAHQIPAFHEQRSRGEPESALLTEHPPTEATGGDQHGEHRRAGATPNDDPGGAHGPVGDAPPEKVDRGRLDYHPATVAAWLKKGGPSPKRTIMAAASLIDEATAVRIGELLERGAEGGRRLRMSRHGRWVDKAGRG